MKPTPTHLTKVEKAVIGYCDIHGICVSIFHDLQMDGEWLSRFRISDHPNDSVIIRWKECSEARLPDTIDHVCRGIYNDWKRTKLDSVDISKEMDLLRYHAYGNSKPTIPEPKKVIFNSPCTIVLWPDNTKTIVRCQEGDTYDPEHGLAMAIVKKMYGNTGKYCEIFKKWIKEEENDPPEIPSISFEEALEIMKKQAIEGLSWTLTKEKLPSESGDYLVYDSFTGSSYVYEYDKTNVNDVIYFQRNVSHWMPVPAAPITKKGE